MRSVVQTLQRAINSFDSIKEAIEEKGITVGNKPVSEYADCIAQIETGSSNLQDKIVDPDTSVQVVVADTEYDGLSSVTINAVDNSIDENIVANNIKKGVSILGVTGTYESGASPVLESIEVNPSLSEQNIIPSAGYDGISAVKVNPVTSLIDENIIPENIKAGVEILSVQGNYEDSSINKNPTKLNYLYANSDLLNLEEFNSIDTSNVTEMRYAFSECNLKNIDISSWDFSKCTTETYMFSDCINVEQIKLPENTNVKVATYMFSGCTSLKIINGSIIIDGASTANMFRNCKLLEEVTIKSFGASVTTNSITLDLSASSVLNVQKLVDGLESYTGGKTRIIKVYSGLATEQLVADAAAKGYTLQ